MKKALFVIAALASCMTVSAKYWFGGSIGYDLESKYDTEAKYHFTNFCPSFGMVIEDNLELGLDMDIHDTKYYSGQKAFEFDFAPFLRYTFLRDGNFSMFVQGGFEYGIYSPSGYNYWHLSFLVQPGICYKLSEHFSLVSKFEGIYYTHESRPDDLPPYQSTFKNNAGFGVDFSFLSFGLVYEF